MNATLNTGARPARSGALVSALSLVAVAVAIIGAIAWGSARFIESAEATATLGGTPPAPLGLVAGSPGNAEGPPPAGDGGSTAPLPEESQPTDTDAGQQPGTQPAAPKEVTATWQGLEGEPWQLAWVDEATVENPEDPITLIEGDRLRIENRSYNGRVCVISDYGDTGLPEPLEGDIELNDGESAVYLVSLDLPEFKYFCAPPDAQPKTEDNDPRDENGQPNSYYVATVTVSPAGG